MSEVKKCDWCGRRIGTNSYSTFFRSYCCKKCFLEGEAQHEREVEASGGRFLYYFKKILFGILLVIVAYVVMYFVGRSMSL